MWLAGVWRVCGGWASLSHLPQIDPQLVQPTMRSAVEEQLNLIAKGKVSTRALLDQHLIPFLLPPLLPPLPSLFPPSQADFDLVLRHTLEIFRAKFEYFRSNVAEMDELFEASFSSVAESGRPLSRWVSTTPPDQSSPVGSIPSLPPSLPPSQVWQVSPLPQVHSSQAPAHVLCPLQRDLQPAPGRDRQAVQGDQVPFGRV